MTTAGFIGRGLAWNGIGTVLAKIFAIVNVFIVLTYLSVYEYGLIELTMSIVSTIGLFLLPGLASAILVDLGIERGKGDFSRMKTLFWQFLFLNTGLGIIACALLFFGSTVIAEITGNILIDKFFKIVSFTFLIAPLRLMSTMLPTVLMRYADQSLFTAVEEFVKGIALLLFLVWLGSGAEGLLYATVLAPLITSIIYAPRTYSAYQTFGSAPMGPYASLFELIGKHRLWSVSSSYANMMSQNMRLWIIKIFLGTEAVGLYAFAYGIFSNLASLLPLGVVLTPLLPRYVHDIQRVTRIVRASFKVQLIIAFALAIAAAILTIPFVTLLFPHFYGAVALIFLMLLALIPNSLASILTPVFAAFRAQKSIFFATFLKFILIVGTLPIYIHYFGLVGAGVELVITTTILLFERQVRARRYIDGEFLLSRNLLGFDIAEREVMRLLARKYKLWNMKSDQNI